MSTVKDLELNLRGLEQGWVWAFQIRAEFDVRSDNFKSWPAFREWAIDPQFQIRTRQDVYSPQKMTVRVFYPNAALRILGFDLACGLCVRPPIKEGFDR